MSADPAAIETEPASDPTPVPIVRLPVDEPLDEPTAAEDERAPARAWPWMLLVLLVAVAARAWGMDQVAPDAAGIEQAALARNLGTGAGAILHPRVDWGGAGSGEVQTGLPLHAWTLAQLARATGRSVVELGPALNLAVFALTALALFALVRRLFDPAAGAFAVLALALAPLGFELSRSLRAEPLHLLAAVTTLSAFASWTRGGRAWAGVLALVAFATALSMHLAHVALALPLLALAAQRHGWRLVARPALWLFALLALGSAAAWHAWAFRLGREGGNVLAGFELPARLGAFPWGDARWLQLLQTTGTDLVHALTTAPGLLLLGVGVLSCLLARRGLVLLTWLLGVALCVALVPRTDARLGVSELLPLMIVATASIGQAASELLRSGVLSRPALALLFAATTLAAVLEVRAGAPIDTAPREAFAARLAERTPAEQLVVVVAEPDAQSARLPGRHTLADGTRTIGDPRDLYRAQRRGWTLAPDQLTPTRLDELTAAGAGSLAIWHESEGLSDALATVLGPLGPPLETGPGWTIVALQPPGVSPARVPALDRPEEGAAPADSLEADF